jgi:hypothetical protein
MARTTSSAVQGVLLRDYDSRDNPSLTPFIDTASSVVDDVALCAVNKGTPLSDAKLELIERWLSAHCYAMNDQPYAEKKTMQASAVFQGRTGMYLEATKYGQMAVSLDPTGCLSAIASGSRKKASIAWLGLPESEQTPYRDRN